jgi:hypothetical protein
LLFEKLKSKMPVPPKAGSEVPLNPPFSKGERVDPLIRPKGKALLPLKKGGREGFLGKPFS